ncbi:MAG: hypothetical protein GF309_10275, partial [Candidatus Lokiarchaeota archaeon]|nr:hypothetical protein [Candidatus Lokiarchaeota archaeon]
MTASLTAYGGINEIGGNKLLLKIDNSSLFLDFGLSFKAKGRFFEEYMKPRSKTKLHDLLKLSLLPTVDGIYRKDALSPEGMENLKNDQAKRLWESDLQSYEEAKDKCDWTPDAVFLSHAHDDHCGYVPFLGDIRIISTDTTQTILEAVANIGNKNGFDDELLHQ